MLMLNMEKQNQNINHQIMSLIMKIISKRMKKKY